MKHYAYIFIAISVLAIAGWQGGWIPALAEGEAITTEAVDDNLTEEERLAAEEEQLKAEELFQRRLQQNYNNLAHINPHLVEAGIFWFDNLGEEAVPHLIKVLKDRDNNQRLLINTIYALGRFGARSKKAVPVMMSYLKEEDTDMLAVTLIALGKIGRAADDAVPLMEPLLYHDDAWVQRSALDAMEKIRTKHSLRALKRYYKKKEDT